jgi:hypothetical protein
MIRIFISVLLFYFTAAMIFGALADLKANSLKNFTVWQRFKASAVFFLFAMFLFVIGLVVWPNQDMVKYPRYYIGQVAQKQNGKSFKVRIKKNLTQEELALVVSKIKSDSSHVRCDEILFYLPSQNYNNHPYANYNYLNDDELWDKVVNKYHHRPYGLVVGN